MLARDRMSCHVAQREARADTTQPGSGLPGSDSWKEAWFKSQPCLFLAVCSQRSYTVSLKKTVEGKLPSQDAFVPQVCIS